MEYNVIFSYSFISWNTCRNLKNLSVNLTFTLAWMNQDKVVVVLLILKMLARCGDSCLQSQLHGRQ
jgi:hypothetical protein